MNLTSIRKSILVLSLFILFSTGCSVLNQGYETPVVSVRSFKALPAHGMAPEFEVKLHIVNPNRSDLNLVGVAYTLSIEDHKIFTGVSNELPTIPGYGEKDIVLNGSLNLFGGVRLFSDLVRNQARDKITYRLDIKLDTGSFSPIIRVSKKGEFDFPVPK